MPSHAEIQILANASQLGVGLRQAETQLRSFAASVAAGVGSAMNRAQKKLTTGGALKNAGGFFGGEMMTRGLDAITTGATNVRDFERSLTRLQITANKGPEMAARWRTSIRSISRETGIASDEILGSAQTYIDLTGDVGGAEGAMKSFARIAQASGSSSSDIATATAAMQQSMHLDPKDIEAAFSGLIVQGKAGAVSLKDMGGELSSLLPRFAKFKGASGVEGVKQMGAAFQVVRQGFGSSAEAATGLESLMGSLTENAKKFQKAGIQIYDRDPKTGARNLKPFLTIIEAIANSKLAKDPTKLGDAFGRKEASQAFDMIKRNLGLYHELYDAASDTGAVQRDLSAYLESDAGRLDKAFNDMKLTIAEAFTPDRIRGFVSAIESLSEKLGPVVDAVGTIGDGVGKLYGVGQSLRGVLSDNGNPFGGTAYINAKAGGLQIRGSMADQARAAADNLMGNSNPLLEQAKHRRDALVADHEAWSDAANDIVDAQVGDRSTPESVRRAMGHIYHKRRGGDQGDTAETVAGEMYIKQLGIRGGADISTQTGAQIQASIVGALVKAITQAGLQAPTLKIGDNQVAKAVGSATHARREAK